MSEHSSCTRSSPVSGSHHHHHNIIITYDRVFASYREERVTGRSADGMVDSPHAMK